MTSPRDAEPDPRFDRLADDADPTGVRDMLSALPDPGPMPADLIHRISASLAAEHARQHRGRAVHHDGDHGTRGVIQSLDETRERRARLGRSLPAVAVAASIVVLAGAVIFGVFAANTGLGMMAGSDSSAESAVSDTRADQEGDASGAEPFGSNEGAPQAEDTDEAQSLVAGGAPILATGAILTSATVADHARAMRDGSAMSSDAEAERTMADSPVGTPQGAADCLGGLLSVTPEEASGLLAAVDFVDFDGAPAALILAHEDRGAGPPEDTEAHLAYIVRRDCAAGTAVPLDGPVRIDT